jgi:hypothetical protein
MRRQYSTLLAIVIGILIVLLSALFALLENMIGH